MIFPVIVPKDTGFECSEVHYVLGIGEIPAATFTIDALSGRFAWASVGPLPIWIPRARSSR